MRNLGETKTTPKMTVESDAVIKSNKQFSFKVADDNEKPAIWLRLREKEVMVLPMPLFESLCGYEKQLYISKGIKASFHIYKNEVSGYYYDETCGSYQIEYERDMFVDSAISALTALCQSVIAGNEPPYNRFTKETAECMLIDLQHIVIPKSCAQIFYEEIHVEDFNFRILEPYNCDTAYEIKIGDRTYVSNLSDWTTDFDILRNEIESFIYAPWKDQSDIKLYYEDSPTILRLKMRNLYWNKSGLNVAIIPDEFSRRPAIFAWCKPQQLVSSLYLGILELFTMDTEWFDDGFDGDWDTFRLKSYNQFQSNVIEDYIKGMKESNRTASRNRVLRSVEEMLEDYQNLKSSLNQIPL